MGLPSVTPLESSASTINGAAALGRSGECTTNLLSLLEIQRLLQGVHDLLAGCGVPLWQYGARWCWQVWARELSLVGASTSMGVSDVVCLVDLAKEEVYVRMEGPLGAHLRAKVRENMERGVHGNFFLASLG